MATGSLAPVLVFAAGAGLATFFAPCAFPLLPGYVGYYLRGSEAESSGLGAALVAAGGALLSLSAVAALAYWLGRTATAVLPLFEPVVGAGLAVAGAFTLADAGPEVRVPLPARPESRLGFGVFGAAYALAAAGCVVPLFLGVLAQALAVPGPAGVAVLGAYALGVAAPLVGVTLLAAAGVETWREAGRHTRLVTVVAGLVMVAAGLGQLYLSVVVLDVL